MQNIFVANSIFY